MAAVDDHCSPIQPPGPFTRALKQSEDLAIWWSRSGGTSTRLRYAQAVTQSLRALLRRGSGTVSRVTCRIGGAVVKTAPELVWNRADVGQPDALAGCHVFENQRSITVNSDDERASLGHARSAYAAAVTRS